MTTSNRSAADTSIADPVWDSGGVRALQGLPAAVRASLPDPAVIAQLANEFFSALPGRPPTPAVPADLHAAPPQSALPAVAPPGELASLPAASAVPPTSALSPPSDADLRALPATLADSTATPPQPAFGAPLGATSESPFYFVDATQPALSGVPTPHEPQLSGLFTLPGIPGLQSLPGVTAVPASAPAASAVRDLPGASPYYFFDTERGAAQAAAPALSLESFEFRPELVPDLGFSARPFDPRVVRRDFPILQEQVHGRPLIWLDNAATTQKPQAVIDRLAYFYQHENSNIHRAAHELAARATDAYEAAREKVRRFLNASSTREIVFVRGATEGINLVAQSWGRRNIEKDDEIVITWLEHHANIVPWQQLCADKGARLRVAPVDDDGQIILEEYEKLFSSRTKLASITQVSNALGTITPVREMVEIAHRHGARVLVDGAQAVSHLRADVQILDCDWYVFSGHKVFAPTGIGVVFGKAELLDQTPPWQGGGNMIADVTFEKTLYQPAPARFEAGTGNIADAVGLGAAIDYLERIGIENVTRYEHELLLYATHRLASVPGLRLVGTAREKAGVLSFVLDGFRTEEVGTALNQEGIAVRSGHHCAQPILRRFGLESTVRPSLALYNTCEDIDALVTALLRIQPARGQRGR